MLTLAIACVLSATDGARPVPPPAETLFVLPLEVDGELPDKWRAEAERRMRAGFQRGDADIVHAEPGDLDQCRDRECIRGVADKATHVVRAVLHVAAGARDYAFAIDVASTRTGEVVATVAGDCDLCGFEEVGALIEAKAAATTASVLRLRAAIAIVRIISLPPGALLEVDGHARGTTPTSLELAPGVHKVRVAMPGYRPQVVEIDAIEGLRKTFELPLVTTPSALDARRKPSNRAAVVSGGVLTAIGIAALVVGGSLLAVDGRPHRSDCEADVAGNCRFLYSTRNAGIATLAVGAATTVVGIVLVTIVAKIDRKSQRGAAPRISPAGGLTLRF